MTIELDLLRNVERAQVRKGDVPAGTLARRPDGGVEFRYLESYLAREDAPGIAFTLPRSDEPVVAPAGAVPPFFAGLLPEGVRLQAVVTATRTSADDHLSLLLAVGEDAIGDVTVSPEGVHELSVAPTVDERDIRAADLWEIFARAVSPEPHSFDRVALPGVQPKVSAHMVSTPLRTTSGPAILKLNPERGYPRLVENEAFFLDMAEDCGLPVPPRRLVTDRHGHAGLLVERFDRACDESGRWRRLPQEDACQLLARYPADKYRIRAQDAISTAADTVEQNGGSRRLALRRLFEVVAFSYLIGNGDLHGKNISVRQAPSGVWEVTPAYDLVTTQPYAGWKDPMALALYGRANRLDRAHLMASAERMGLPPRALARALDAICEAAGPWIDRVPEIGLDPRSTELLQSMMRARLAELMG